jgi:hypothetical protein
MSTVNLVELKAQFFTKASFCDSALRVSEKNYEKKFSTISYVFLQFFCLIFLQFSLQFF